ncbi:LysR family transcriptional regulator [Paraburkholderia sp. LEh10]|jgi:DNA-binding transcriptional LysR family regulator|uniref:LysR family transcriptional regulator n=1 Tax=Paraburkholderia sp. LEh10 TaxID=2821353 RepID=UPI001AEA2521|nr:LysR family transcriptional regulator [Paraburkholderia sp. LEh10]MBP0589412.1 LysR family transcriptional regulator [Paraburkholderia sp. LEh10]
MDRLQGIEAFVRVAQTRSFSDAARILGVAKSAVSLRVQHLEESIGTPLLLRNTRNVVLSEAGMAFYQECAQLVDRATEMLDEMRDRSGTPHGVLRVHVLPGFAVGFFGEVIGRFQRNYPGITLDLLVSDAIVDPIREGFDCVIQMFEPVSKALILRKLYTWRGVFCASPSYLAEHGVPCRPADLGGHRLGLYSRYPTGHRWLFQNGAEEEEMNLQAALRTNSVQLLLDYARAGSGIVCVPTYIAARELLDGTLRAVLTGYEIPMFWLSAVYPAAQRGQLKLSLFLEALAANPGEDPPWDRELYERRLISPPKFAKPPR